MKKILMGQRIELLFKMLKWNRKHEIPRLKDKIKNLEYKYEDGQKEKNELRILVETQLMSLSSLQKENKKYKMRMYLLYLYSVN